MRTRDVVYSSECESSDLIKINSCGEQWLQGRNHDTLRPDGRVDFAFQYVSEGKGYAEAGGKVYPVEAKSMILYFPMDYQHYFFKEDDRTLLKWVHFTGTCCEILNHFRGKSPIIIRIFDYKEFECCLNKMLRAYYIREDYFEKVCEGYLLVLLAVIAKNKERHNDYRTLTRRSEIEKVLRHMHVYYNQPIDLDIYADMCFISRSRFIHLFKECTGVSPYRYQMRIRMERAMEMIMDSSISIKECATAVGFEDGSYFCRVFKKYTGFRPSDCKKG